MTSYVQQLEADIAQLKQNIETLKNENVELRYNLALANGRANLLHAEMDRRERMTKQEE